MLSRSTMSAQKSSPENSNQHPSGFRVEKNVLIGYDAPLIMESNNIGEIILNRLKSKPNFVGQIDAFLDKRSTFAEMKERSVKCALWLKSQGVGPGSIVAVSSPNQSDTYVPCLAAFYVGATANPWDYRFDFASSKYYMSLTNPKIIFAGESSAPIIAQVLKENGRSDVKVIVFGKLPGLISLDEIIQEQGSSRIEDFRCAEVKDPSQTALMIFTSGSSGRPKAVELPHTSLVDHLRLGQIGSVQGCTSMACTPFYWVSSMLLMIHSILQYCKRIISRDLEDDKLCRIIEKYELEWVTLGGSMTNYLVKSGALSKYELPSLKHLVIAGAPITRETFETVVKELPHAAVVHAYGMTEVGLVTCEKISRPRKINSVGIVMRNVRVKVVDTKTGSTLGPNQTGELCVKSTTCMKSYYGDSEATRMALDSEGWLHTGDAGYYDQDYDIYVVDRFKELIKYRGIHVSPCEIERLLESHPCVLEAVVVPVPHIVDEEHPLAFVSKIQGQEVTETELVSYVKNNLMDHNRLRAGVKFLDKLPHTSSGKIARKKLKELAKSYAIVDV